MSDPREARPFAVVVPRLDNPKPRVFVRCVTEREAIRLSARLRSCGLRTMAVVDDVPNRTTTKETR